jgi:hypothetical protein
VWVEVSDDDFRDFVRFIRPQISGLLEISHRWLTRRAALPKNRRKKKRLAGVQMYVCLSGVGRALRHCGVRSATRVDFLEGRERAPPGLRADSRQRPFPG